MVSDFLPFRSSPSDLLESISIFLANWDEGREKQRDYLENKLKFEKSRWATFERLERPILLQIVTTSPLEGFHGDLKSHDLKKQMRVFTLWQIISRVCDVGKRWHENADLVAAKEASSPAILALTTIHKGLGELPLALQKLTFEQLRTARQDEEEVVDYFLLADTSNLRCPCKFWRRYRVPCRHFWRKHLFGDIDERITPAQFEQLVGVFEGLGWKAFEEKFDDPLADEDLEEGLGNE